LKKHINILLVEDDPSLGYVTKDNLEEYGYRVHWAKNGLDGWTKFKDRDYDLCLLDIMLPKLDGFSLGSQIREVDKDLPILFLTAKGMQEDKIKGFELGADDYIVKPFNMKELILRIEVFLKRSFKPQNVNSKFIFNFQGVKFIHPELSLLVNGDTSILTQKEADLLLLFCRNRNILIKREDILNQLWGDDDYFMGRSLDVFISRIRKFLKGSSIKIVNYHGIGFKFQADELSQTS